MIDFFFVSAKSNCISVRQFVIQRAGKNQAINARISQIKKQVDDTDSDYDKEKLQERLAKLAGGVAVINVGAATETEMKEKKARVEDALHATRAASQEGIVPGGGVALIRCIPILDKMRLEGDEKIGVAIVKRAIEEPLRQITQNAGLEGSVVVQRIKQEKTNTGYDVSQDAYVDMIEAGVIDPTKVTRSALQNAVSIAGMFLTTEAVVTDLPKKDEPAMPMGGGMGGGMGMM